jgi:hypothetical protein
MKILHSIFLFVSILFVGCNLQPLPLDIPKDSFDLRFEPASGYTSSALVDGVQLKNGDFIVVGRAVKGLVGDILVARFDKEGKQIIKAETYDAGNDEEVENMAIDNDENIYIAGRSTSLGLLAKFSTKNGGFDKAWIKTTEYGVLATNSTFKRVLYDNNQLYIVDAVKFGSNASNYGIRRLDTAGTVISPCATGGKVTSLVALDAAFSNGKIYVCGHTNTSESTQLSWITSNLCQTPIRQNYNLAQSVTFDAARSLVVNTDYSYVLSNDQPATDIYKPILYRNNLTDLSIIGNIRAIDPTTVSTNLKSYQSRVINSSGSGSLLYVAGFSIVNDSQEYTDFRKIETASFGDVWSSLKRLKLYPEQVITTQDGGYLIIGKSGDIGKVVKTNSAGDCTSCK